MDVLVEETTVNSVMSVILRVLQLHLPVVRIIISKEIPNGRILAGNSWLQVSVKKGNTCKFSHTQNQHTEASNTHHAEQN